MKECGNRDCRSITLTMWMASNHVRSHPKLLQSTYALVKADLPSFQVLSTASFTTASAILLVATIRHQLTVHHLSNVSTLT